MRFCFVFCQHQRKCVTVILVFSKTSLQIWKNEIGRRCFFMAATLFHNADLFFKQKYQRNQQEWLRVRCGWREHGQIRSPLINLVVDELTPDEWLTHSLHSPKNHSRQHIQFIHSNSAIGVPCIGRTHKPPERSAKDALRINVYTHSQFDWAIINWIDLQ